MHRDRIQLQLDALYRALRAAKQEELAQADRVCDPVERAKAQERARENIRALERRIDEVMAQA